MDNIGPLLNIKSKLTEKVTFLEHPVGSIKMIDHWLSIDLAGPVNYRTGKAGEPQAWNEPIEFQINSNVAVKYLWGQTWTIIFVRMTPKQSSYDKYFSRYSVLADLGLMSFRLKMP